MEENAINPPIKRSLRYDFTASETHDLSMELAKQNKKYQALEDEKKSVNSDLKSKMDETIAKVRGLSDKVTAGYEYREIECAVDYHKPSQGMKTLTRSDNNEQIIEKMEQWEFHLFNQPTDAEIKSLDDAAGGFKPVA